MMQTKNKPAPLVLEREHIDRIKAMACSCCDHAGPSDDHEIVQGLWMTTLPLCKPCHTGADGIHGTKALMRVYKQTEMTMLNRTMARLLYEKFSPARRGAPVREKETRLGRPSKIVARPGYE